MQKKQVNREYVTISKKLDVPEDKLKEYKEAFDMFDRNKKGTLSIGDITKIMKKFRLSDDKRRSKINVIQCRCIRGW